MTSKEIGRVDMDWFCLTQDWSVGLKKWRVSWLTQRLLAYQERFCSMDLVT